MAKQCTAQLLEVPGILSLPAERERERESQSIRARFLLTGPLPRLPHLLYPNISSPIYIRVEMSWISEFQASLALGETWKNCSDFICLQFFRVKM